jgi:hypothetical protein
MIRLILFVGLLIFSNGSLAVTGNDIQARYSLVGVIAAEQDGKKSIVVLKDHETKRSLTLSAGELLPGELGWMVSGVMRNTVLLQNGEEQVRVTYGEEQVADPSAVANEDLMVQTKVSERVNVVSDDDRHDSAGYSDRMLNRKSIEELSAADEYHSETLEVLEPSVRQQLRVIKKKSNKHRSPVAGTAGDTSEQQEPVFSDLPDGPTYFE